MDPLNPMKFLGHPLDYFDPNLTAIQRNSSYVSWTAQLVFRPYSSNQYILKSDDMAKPIYTQNVTCSFLKLVRSEVNSEITS